jgi:hypothetical protein
MAVSNGERRLPLNLFDVPAVAAGAAVELRY